MKNNGRNGFVAFEEPMTLEDRLPLMVMEQKGRRTLQRMKTFGAEPWKRRGQVPPYSHRLSKVDENYSSYLHWLTSPRGSGGVLTSMNLEHQMKQENTYSHFFKTFGVEGAKILSDYGVKESIHIQKILDREGLSLLNLVNFGIFVIDKSQKLYFLDGQVEAALAESGLKPSQFFEYHGAYSFNYTLSPKQQFAIVTLPSGKEPIHVSPKDIETERKVKNPLDPKPQRFIVGLSTKLRDNLFEGHYRNSPEDASHYKITM